MSIQKVIRVMLISDHKSLSWGLEQLLSNAEPAMEVVASTGDMGSALLLANTLCPDVIVLDMETELDQESVVVYLPALLDNGVTRIVLFSSVPDRQLLVQGVRSGARGVAGKDTAVEQLIDTVVRVHQGELCLDQELIDSMICAFSQPASAPDPEELRIARLTAKERKIIAMMVEGSGALNKAIAQRAFISEQTLRNHLTSIYSKLGVTNRLELYVYATRNKLAEPMNA
ncbi:LuxR C-terminal-related transcriptional regulator [Janthinobacterium aquaticum]|uniref:LuxR C-terminal-related transcriptional regulator n=1 Tax=Janthinobacterium sp. FT58W TaxID=2654254 RepID=UPI0012646AD5|nr:response regulator transcription factor [Janthinobacterium sp. FT58W]KAB8042819.1 response regulator [Janthinobacterium sp. FT58W]